MKKRLMFYCQHVLGMGHLVRSLEIVRVLDNFEVYFLNGGEVLGEIPVASSVKVINLPSIRSDAEFTGLQATDQNQSLEETREIRRRLLLAEFERIQPDLLVIELFPFGRRQFAFELVPLLARIRLGKSETRVVCSLRDILVSKSKQRRHEEWVCSIINRYFDLILVHADPGFQSLNGTFSAVAKLTADIRYTGYVAQALETQTIKAASLEPEFFKMGEGDEPLIVVSIGGGRVGYELLECAVSSSAILDKSNPHRMLILSGPYLPDGDFTRLVKMVEGRPNIAVHRYTAHFLRYLENAALLISLAGYNTCMNILTAGIPALVLPFVGGGNDEQTIRARKLEERGVLTILQPEDLQPKRLSRKISHMLRSPVAIGRVDLDLQGAANTAKILENLVNSQNSTDSLTVPEGLITDPPPPKLPDWQLTLRQCLLSLRSTQKQIRIFLRDDDIDEDEGTLKHLLDISQSHGVPVNLQIIPGSLTDPATSLLENFKRINPDLIGLNQHGWLHRNHEKNGRKCEFGVSRSFAEQLEDISKGKEFLESVFPDYFYPVFTPPWNRCTLDTYRILDEMGYPVLSKDLGPQLVTGYRFQEISTTLDLNRWNAGAIFKSPQEIAETLVTQMKEMSTIGILLHHKVMDANAFLFLDRLLQELVEFPNVQFHTFESLMDPVENPASLDGA